LKIINIKGAIIRNNDKWIYDWLEMEATCPKDVISQLNEANGQDVEVHINSGGGSVYAGSEIYTTIKDYKGKTTAKIVGIAASAASVAAMACEKILMSPTAQMMIHKAQTYADGNHRNMEHTADVLKSHDEAICNAYVLKTGLDRETILQMMDQETYFTAQEALKNNFADEIMFDENQQIVASVSTSDLLPAQVINKIRSIKDKLKSNENGEGNPQPTSLDKKQEPDQLTAQQKEFQRLKNKIYGGIL
jgi:ATP-dependent protease ClpP protease subunit